MLPLLGILSLKARDIVGYAMPQFIVHVPLVLFLVWSLNYTLLYVAPSVPHEAGFRREPTWAGRMPPGGPAGSDRDRLFQLRSKPHCRRVDDQEEKTVIVGHRIP
jgi:hypothetical protein